MPPALVGSQTTNGASNGGNTAMTQTLAQATTIGNTLFLFHGDDNSRTISSISGGGVWIKQVALSTAPSAIPGEFWACVATAAVSTLNITFSGSVGAQQTNISEFSGMPASLSVNSSAVSGTLLVGTGGHDTLQSITPSGTGSGLIIAFAVGYYDNESPMGSGFTWLTNPKSPESGGCGAHGFGYLSVASFSGSYTTSFTNTGDYTFAGAMIGFDGVAAAPATRRTLATMPLARSLRALN